MTPLLQRIAIIGGFVLIVAGGIAVWIKQDSTAPMPAPARLGPITIATSESLTAALIWAAAEQGLFDQAGIDVKLKGFSFGKQAMDALIHNQADMGATAEYVVARLAPENPHLRVLATISSSHDIRILAIADRGIARPVDLIGKRIGVTLGSATEFLIDRWFTLHGMESSAVKLVNLSPPDMAEALAENRVDAVIVWQPYVQAVLDRLGERVIVFDGQPGQDYYFVLAGQAEWIDRHREEVRRLLKALRQAERWAEQDPGAFIAYLKVRGFVKPDAAPDVLAAHRFMVSLSSALVAALGEERRWLKKGQGRSRFQGDLFDLVEPGPLREIAPEVVTVVR